MDYDTNRQLQWLFKWLLKLIVYLLEKKNGTTNILLKRLATNKKLAK